MGKFSKTMYLDGGGSITLRRAPNGGTTITLNVGARAKPPSAENELSVMMTQEEMAELSAATREESSPGWA